MTGIFFDYEPGRIDARFSHRGKWDDINLEIRMDGDVTTTTECDDEWHLAEPESWQKDGAEFTVYVSSVFCPFKDFIRFLEAISIDVQECGFRWEAEGPEGSMRWSRRFQQDTGFLTVEWSSEKQISHRMMLNTRQAVRMLYGAFRTFIESSDYDPIRYERLTCGEGFSLVLADASLDDLARRVATFEADKAEDVIQYLWDTVSCRCEGGLKSTFSIDYFVGTNVPKARSSADDSWIKPEWNALSADQRVATLRTIFDWESTSASGANLRELRSKLVEDWLALPEPPPRRKIPVPLSSPAS